MISTVPVLVCPVHSFDPDRTFEPVNYVGGRMPEAVVFTGGDHRHQR